MTLSIPEELYKRIKDNTSINWSDLARHAFEDYLNKIDLANKISNTSELTEQDVLEIGELIKERAWKRHMKKG